MEDDYFHVFFYIPNDISTAAIATPQCTKNHLRVTPFSTDTTPLNYYKTFNDRTSNISLSSTFINTQETWNGTRSLTQQDIQTPTHFVNEEIVETLTTTTQQNISHLHPIITTPHNRNKTPFPPRT